MLRIVCVNVGRPSYTQALEWGWTFNGFAGCLIATIRVFEESRASDG